MPLTSKVMMDGIWDGIKMVSPLAVNINFCVMSDRPTNRPIGPSDFLVRVCVCY